jgi:hypothetical protein
MIKRLLKVINEDDRILKVVKALSKINKVENTHEDPKS